jgi:hypothetical protein
MSRALLPAMPASQQPHKAAGKLLPVSELQQVRCLPAMAHKAAGKLLPVSAPIYRACR